MAKNALPLVSGKAPQGFKSHLSIEISRLESLPRDLLRYAWASEFRKQPPNDLSRDLLLRTLVWRLHEKAFGGHDPATLKLLDAYARGRANDVIFHRLKSGTVLAREYRGIRHVVTITRDGFIWQDKTYANLSAIARAITGSNWNGPRFFGLREKPARDAKNMGVRTLGVARELENTAGAVTVPCP